jgi:hypothetical protein
MELYDGSSVPIDDPTTPAKPIVSHVLQRHNEARQWAGEAHASGSASGGGDGTSGSGVGSSWSDGTILPGLPGLPRANYVIVPETTAPHHTLATAQGLPDLPYFGVVGTLGSGDPIDLYRLTLSGGVDGLNFGLVSDQSTPAVPMQLQVFDGSGHMLGEWSLGGQGTTTLFGGLGALPAGSTIYFGITAGNPGGPGGASAGINYQLWVGLQSATDSATIVAGTGTTVPSTAFLAATALPLSAVTALGALPSGGSSQAASTAPPNGGGNLRVAVGSPATRSAGPSGGLLSEGDPAPAVPSDFSAAVNKEWDEPTPTATTIRPAGEVERTEPSGREKDPDVLVAVNGPGGFPLLGAVAIGHRRRHPTTIAGDLATAPDRVDGDLQVVARSVPAEPEVPLTEGDIAARSPTFRHRPWSGWPISAVSAGLGMATVFTLNAVLSQPMAGFDYLTSRLDADGGPDSRRKDRPRRSASPPDGSSSFGRPSR